MPATANKPMGLPLVLGNVGVEGVDEEDASLEDELAEDELAEDEQPAERSYAIYT